MKVWLTFPLRVGYTFAKRTKATFSFLPLLWGRISFSRRSPMRRPNSLLLFLISLVVLCVPLHAQTVDTAIVGTVTDHSGAVISGARVTVTSESTGIAKSAVTASTGEYTINYLLPGSYDVAVTANGFTTTRQQGIEVQLSQEARVNFQLQIGAVTEQVNVEGGQP